MNIPKGVVLTVYSNLGLFARKQTKKMINNSARESPQQVDDNSNEGDSSSTEGVAAGEGD